MSQETKLVNIEEIAKNLSVIPGIGPKVGMMLAEIGINDVSDLVERNPESLYDDICRFRGEILDRCVLYHFRCAVYFASNKTHEPKLLKWWNWK